MTRVRAVTFDAGGTLIHPWPSVGHVYAAVAAEHGCVADPALLNGRFRKAWAAQSNFHHTRAEWAALVDESFGAAASPPPSRTFFDAIYDRFKEPQVWRVQHEALDVLQRLRAGGCRLGLISNWDERLRPLLSRLGLAPFFDAITISCEVGVRKPAPGIFQTAALTLGVPPASILHVGDSWEMDVCGARAAGFQIAWLAGDPARDPAATPSLAAVCAAIPG